MPELNKTDPTNIYSWTRDCILLYLLIPVSVYSISTSINRYLAAVPEKWMQWDE